MNEYCESQIVDMDERRKKIDANNTVVILYINENIDSIRKAFRGWGRVTNITTHIETESLRNLVITH